MAIQKIPETLTWQADNNIQPKRSFVWYIFFSIISVALLGYAIYSRSVITFLTFFLIIVVILIFSSQTSQEKTYKITKTGISSGNINYPYAAIKKFWIVYNPPEVKTLNLETTAYINNRVILQIGNQDPVLIKLVLSKYIREDIKMEESLTEALARRLKI